MIVLTKSKEIAIPNYDDLANKPMINGVTLEGNKSTEELGIDVDLSDYYTKSEIDDSFQPKGDYQPAGNYLTSVPSEYVTETELNEALTGLSGSEVPYVVIEYKNATTLTTISGDLQATLNAAKNKQPFLAYFYNTYAAYGKIRTLYPFTYVTVETSGFSLQYHTEVGLTHKDIVINGSYDTITEEYSLTTFGQNLHSYVTTTELNSKQDTLVSGTNIKTINGESILGSGDLTIESGGTTDLSNYYTKGEVNEQINDISTNLADNYYTILEVDELVESAEPDLTGYATETWVGNHYQPKGNYLTSIPSEYATKTYVDTQIGDINTILENIIG